MANEIKDENALPCETEKKADAQEAQPMIAEKTDPQEMQPETEEKKQPRGFFRKRINKKEKKKKTVMEEILSWVGTLLAALVIATAFRMFIGEPIRVDGTSMTNTLLHGEVVFASKIDYLLGEMKRGDIVICRYPNRMDGAINLGAALSLDTYTLFVKRLVALPGDTLYIKDGVLYVNDEAVEDPEFMASKPRDFDKIRLGNDQYFVMGDNRLTSHDSRSSDVRAISKSAIMGKVKCVLWPLSKIRGVE